jgi:hypothetical protein
MSVVELIRTARDDGDASETATSRTVVKRKRDMGEIVADQATSTSDQRPIRHHETPTDGDAADGTRPALANLQPTAQRALAANRKNRAPRCSLPELLADGRSMLTYPHKPT